MTNMELSRDRSAPLISGGFEIPTLPDWFHEPGIDSYYRPWQHTPLDPYSPEVRGHQAELRELFEKLADTPPPYLQGKGLEDLVRLDYMSGMITREAQSASNFRHWINNHADEFEELNKNPDFRWVLGEGLAGHGSARGQLEILRRAHSLRSLDLQVLSTPFGYRRQHLEPMLQERQTALTEVGATIYDEPLWLENHPPKISMDPSRDIRADEKGRALLVTFKRKVAEVSDLTQVEVMISVMERESWLVLIDEDSNFSPEIIQEMQREPSWAHTQPDFAAMVRQYVMDRIQNTEGAIPLSATTYATRPRAVSLQNTRKSDIIEINE